MTPSSESQERALLQTAERFKAVAHPLRLAICCLLVDGERSIGEIHEALGTTQPNISQHLGILRNRGLLTSRKEANRVYIAIADPRLAQLMDAIRACYCPEH